MKHLSMPKSSRSAMDEQEFQRILELFPIVRSRDYHENKEKNSDNMDHVEADSLSRHGLCLTAESKSSRESTSQSGQNEETEKWQDAWNQGDKKDIGIQGTDQYRMSFDAFWEKLKSAAEKKVGEEEAEKFSKAFQSVYKKLVCEELSPDTVRSFLKLVQASSK